MKAGYPDSYSPERALILAVLQQAIKDCIYPSQIPPARRSLERKNALRFMFDDSYTLWWGGYTYTSPASLLHEVGLDIKEIRVMLRKKIKSPNKDTHCGVLV